jgi:hypothetical protein
MGDAEFPGWTHVYVIYDADVVTDYPGFIESMSPARHVPAGRRPDETITAITEAFTQTEGDEQYDFGYLVKEGSSPRYLPYADRDCQCEDECTCPNAGMHRKWAGILTREQWRVFADAYCIDLDDSTDLPAEYEPAMGAITEYGHLAAISVDNREGWNDYTGSEVIYSTMYLSFARMPAETGTAD